VVPLVAMLARDERRAAEHLPRLATWRERLSLLDEREDVNPHRMARITRRVDRAGADIDFLLNETLGWRGGVVLAWSGMRGAITLAAAQTLPDDTPYRAELILIAFVVAVTTLLLQGLTLPMVIRWVKVPGDDQHRLRTEYANLLSELADSAEQSLATVSDDTDPEVLERVRADSLIGRREASGGSAPSPDHDIRREEYLRLRLLTISAERDTLLDARARGVYSSQTLTAAQRRLDLEETRLQSMSERP
jgi:CPA1 family monovalent cation:H+ antiporter